MPASSSTQPVIIIRKKVAHHGGHHGGAWKVAYADFVTAMMALFIVLWLMASSEQVKKSIAAYFLDPQGTKHEIGSGGATGSGKSMFISVNEMQDLKQKLQDAVRSLPALEKFKDQITMTVTGEGLRIELVENANGVFFETGNARPTELAVEAIGLLAAQLGQLPNSIVIEGHTDAASYGDSHSYSNWELSSDRAHEARRLMQLHGIRQDQVKQIRGYADQSLRVRDKPFDPSNRRISVIVLYGEESPGEKSKTKKNLTAAAAKTEPVKAEHANVVSTSEAAQKLAVKRSKVEKANSGLAENAQQIRDQ